MFIGKIVFELFSRLLHLLSEMRPISTKETIIWRNRKGLCAAIVGAWISLNAAASWGIQVTPLLPSSSIQSLKVQKENLHPTHVSIPDIRMMSLRNAELILRKKGLLIKVLKREFHHKAPNGFVIFQSPPPNQTVPWGSAVDVILSKGPALMPDLRGKTWDTAVAILTGKRSLNSVSFSSYRLKIKRKDVFSNLAPGLVAKQTPPKGSPLEINETILLSVSKGRPRFHGSDSQSTITSPKLEKLPHSHVLQATSPRPLERATRSLEAHTTESHTSPSIPPHELHLQKRNLPQGVPVKLISKNISFYKGHTIFFIGRHKIESPLYIHRNEILLPTKGIPPGTYPLILRTAGKRRIIGHVRIVRRSNHSVKRNVSSKPSEKKAQGAVRQTPPLPAPSSQPLPKTVSSRPSNLTRTFIFTAESRNLARLKDILLKETPWIKINKLRQLRSLKLYILSVQTTHPEKAKKFFEGLISRKLIKSYQPSHIYKTFGSKADPYVSRQYGCQPLEKLLKVQTSCAGHGIRVALLDTGVDIYHEDLNREKIRTKDFTGEDLGKFLTDIHGTALCGIISATPANGKGITGLAPGANIYAIKVCTRISPHSIEATTNSFTLAEGMDYAIQKRVHIINVSIGGPRDRIIEKLVRKARASGIVVVAAMGNGGPRSPPTFPAAYPGVIGVTAVDETFVPYAKAPRNRYVDVAAPGVDVFSLKPGNRYNFYTGTSFAAAYVTGMVALYLSCHPTTCPKDSLDFFFQNALYAPPGLTQEIVGAGVLILSKIPRNIF